MTLKKLKFLFAAVFVFQAVITAGGQSLDATFGNSGKVITNLEGGRSLAYASAVQADGKIVVGGLVAVAFSNTDFALVRYNSNGSLDTAFGANGRVQTKVGTPDMNEAVFDVVIQPDGKIVAAGTYGTNSVAVARYNSDGSLDASFDQDGRVTTAFGTNTSGAGIALQADGKIVVAGSTRVGGSNHNDLLAVRYNADGSLDSTFDSDGIVTTSANNAANTFEEATAVAVQADGKIVVAGVSNGNTIIVRYAANGAPDSSFDADGIVVNAVSPAFDGAKDLKIQTDGKIVVAGDASVSNVTNAVVLRYNSNGTIDSTFDADGAALVPSVSAESVALQIDGKILVAGLDVQNLNDTNFAVLRFNANGALDSTFGGGKVITPIQPNASEDIGRDIFVQTDGKIVVAGSTDDDFFSKFAVVRYNADGTLDASFADNGKALTNIGSAIFGSVYAALQSDGKILAASRITVGSVGAAVVLRYNANGSLDTTFGSGGFTIIPNAFNSVASVVVQNDGKILIGGDAPGNARFVVSRLTANGTLDATFGTNGIVTVTVNNYGLGSKLALQNDGKILLYGTTRNPSTMFGDLALVRFNPNGSPDATFGTNGIVQTDFDGRRDFAVAFRLQTDGKIVAFAMSLNSSAQGEFAVARYNSDGSLDASFDADGKLLITTIPTASQTGDVEIQPDGKILAVSFNRLTRINSDGTLDGGFGSNGTATLPFDATGIELASDAKILAFGTIFQARPSFALTRLTAGGQTDTSFGSNGVYATDFGEPLRATGTDLIRQPDGKLIGIGNLTANFQQYDAAVVRYNLDSVSSDFDFDGDGRSDLSVFRPSNATWYISGSTSGFSGAQFGIASDRIVPADYDGDGKTDLAVYRNGIWYLQRSTLGFTGINFGLADDLPVPADYDGDGKADIAVFRPSNGTWYRINSQNIQFFAVQFGTNGDKPTIGDFDGDGKADVAVYRPSNGTWYRINSSDNQVAATNFGLAEDLVVPADYDGDGKTDIAVFRPSSGTWYLQRSQLGFTGINFGLAGDKPVPADYDGDGKADVAVYRGGTWYLNRSTAGFTGIAFGTGEDLPAPNAFVR